MSSESKKNARTIEGYYNYYGIPSYILKQKNGSYASGYYDWVEGVFKAGGSAKKILWDGIKISFAEAKRLIARYSRMNASEMEAIAASRPDWILLPDEALSFLEQSDEIRTAGQELVKKQNKKRRIF